MDWKAIRREFPAVEGQVWLNTATYGPGPRPVLDAVQESLRIWSGGRGNWLDWEQEAEVARGLFAELLGCDRGCIALVPAVSLAVGQVAAGFPYPAGANVVVGTGEFRSNLYPWMAQQSRGVEVRLVSFRNGRLPLEDLVSAMDQDTAVVAISSIQSSNGYRADLEGLARACRLVGARLCVDATQSVGALRFPLDCCDYVAVAGYKWLLAPRGTAFLYVRPGLVKEMTPFAPGWKTHPQPFDGFYGPPFELPDTAARFDTSLAWASWVGAARALRFIHDIGIAAIEERVLSLATQFREGLPRLGLAPLFEPAESSQVIGLKVPDPVALQRSLHEGRIVAAVRGEFLRVAFHFFNDESDVEQALEALAAAER